MWCMMLTVLQILKLPLHPGNKSHLIVVYDFFSVLLDSVCWYFVEDFCIYIHEWYWLVVLFSVVSLSGFRVILASEEFGSFPSSCIFCIVWEEQILTLPRTLGKSWCHSPDHVLPASSVTLEIRTSWVLSTCFWLEVYYIQPGKRKRKIHKKKELVQSPNSYFMDVKCPGC